MILDKYKSAKLTANVNYLLVPCTEVSLKEYNKIVRYLNRLRDKGLIKCGFTWTFSGGVSISSKVRYKQFNNYEVKCSKTMHEIFINSLIEGKEYCMRIQYKHGTPEGYKMEVPGRRAFVTLRKELKKDGISIENYAIDNGYDVKVTIAKPIIGVKNKMVYDKIFHNTYHLDLNSAYPDSMRIMYPEWSETIERLYKRRKKSPVYKAVLNEAYGFMQSKWVKYKYSHISKFCIEHTIERLRQYEKALEANKCVVLGFNTDGIWFQCEDPNFIDKLIKEKCSLELGGIKIDHKDCILRYKSDGAYEYIENGKYHPVLRGATNLDDYKNRSEWEWGDIYKAVEKRFILSQDEYGVILEDNNESGF